MTCVSIIIPLFSRGFVQTHRRIRNENENELSSQDTLEYRDDKCHGRLVKLRLQSLYTVTLDVTSLHLAPVAYVRRRIDLTQSIARKGIASFCISAVGATCQKWISRELSDMRNREKLQITSRM